jgi:hypothetical protein
VRACTLAGCAFGCRRSSCYVAAEVKLVVSLGPP